MDISNIKSKMSLQTTPSFFYFFNIIFTFKGTGTLSCKKDTKKKKNKILLFSLPEQFYYHIVIHLVISQTYEKMPPFKLIA